MFIILREVMNFMKRIVIFLTLLLLFSSQSYGFDAAVRWSADIDSPLTSSITIHDGTLFLGDKSGTLHALSTDTGAELWAYNAGSSIIGTPLIVSNEVIYAHSDGELSVLDIYDGSVIWRSIPVDGSGSRLDDGAAYGGGLIFTAGNDGRLTAVSDDTGEEVWTYQARQGLRSAPEYGEGLVMLGEYDGLFSMIDAQTGERLNGGGAGGAVNTPAVRDGKVYFSAWDGVIQSIQIKDVIPLWSVNVKDPVTTSPAITEGIIAVGTARGFVFALNEADGKTLWQYGTNGGSVTAKPVVADGAVFACSGDGTVHVIDAGTGKELYKFTAGQGIGTNPAYSGGVLYFGGEKGIIYALQ